MTDRPEIHSRQYHFAFDAPSQLGAGGAPAAGLGGLGYVVPNPVEAPPGWCATDPGTLVRLPLRPDPSANPTDPSADAPAASAMRDLLRRLDDLQPSILLFLNKLQELTVWDELAGSGRMMARRSAGEGIVEVTSSTLRRRSGAAGPEAVAVAEAEVESASSERWLLVSSLLTAPPQVARATVSATKLVMALPLLSAQELRRSPLEVRNLVPAPRAPKQVLDLSFDTPSPPVLAAIPLR